MSAFCGHPPSLPGIWARSAVFCRSRQEVRESSSSRRVETADSAAGLSAGSSIGSRPDNSAGGRLMGLCPLHADHKPSFLVDPRKNLFYCYGCGRGGDVIRFAELYHQVKFPQAVALLHQWRGLAPLLHEAASFYRMQLHRHSEAVAYLYQRGVRSPELIEHMRIGYAPGGCLRGWLTQLGYSAPDVAASRSGDCRRLRRLHASHRLSAGRQPLWPQPVGFGATSSFLAGRQGWLVCVGASPAISGSDSRRGTVRLRRVVAGRFSQRHLLDGKSSQRAPVSATVRQSANRLSGL